MTVLHRDCSVFTLCSAKPFTPDLCCHARFMLLHKCISTTNHKKNANSHDTPRISTMKSIIAEWCGDFCGRLLSHARVLRGLLRIVSCAEYYDDYCADCHAFRLLLLCRLPCLSSLIYRHAFHPLYADCHAFHPLYADCHACHALLVCRLPCLSSLIC